MNRPPGTGPEELEAGADPGGSVRERLAAAGFTLPEVAAPLASYVPAVVDGGLAWTSGQLPLRNGELAASGAVGGRPGDVSQSDAYGLARLCALNALAALESVLGSLDRVRRVVKVVGFVASAPDFTGQPGVVNGASELLVAAFGERGRHARSAVGVTSLPLGAPVEVEVTVSLL